MTSDSCTGKAEWRNATSSFFGLLAKSEAFYQFSTYDPVRSPGLAMDEIITARNPGSQIGQRAGSGTCL